MVRDARKSALLTMRLKNTDGGETSAALILRSGLFGRVSKDGRKCASSP
jgi:hypothetical protein